MISTKTKKKTGLRWLKIVAIVVAALVLMFTAATIVVTVLMNKKFGRADYLPQQVSMNYLYEHYENDYPRVNVSFTSGENTLQGYIYGADNDKGLLVFAHGIGSGHENYMKSLMWFVDNGWRVFAYDAAGSGHSVGAGTKGLPQSALDLNAALNYIEADAELSALPRFLMGHSWGGYAVTAVLNFGHKVDGVASVSGYAVPVEMIYEYAKNYVGDARFLIYPSICLYNGVLFGEYAGLSAVDGINSTDTPVLIIHGTDDKTIDYNGASIMRKRDLITNPNAEYITLEGCSHTGMFDTPEAIAIKAEINETVDEMVKQGESKDSAYTVVNRSADLDAANQPNVEFLSQIENFFEEILDKQ